MDATRVRERLDLRVRPEVKRQIQEAAAIMGQNVTDFVIGALVAASQEVIAKQQSLTLSKRDYDLFMETLDANTEPNEAMRNAAERYRQNPL